MLNPNPQVMVLRDGALGEIGDLLIVIMDLIIFAVVMVLWLFLTAF
jgi:hypothetical protein